MANFPTTLDDNASLHVAKNNLYTTLNAQLLIGETTTMTVVSTTGWDSSGYLSVDNEIIKYATIDATHFYTLTRAQDNTTAAQHEVGTVVELRPIAMHHNDPKDAIIALETKVGVDGSAVTNTLDYKVTVLSGLTGNVDYYVDPVSGDDGNPGTNAQPFLTIQHAVDVIPKFLNNFTASIFLKPSLLYSEFVTIEGYHSGYFGVYSVGYDPATVLITGLTDNDIFDIYNCTALISISSISMRVVSTAGPSSWSGVYVYNSSAEVVNCKISDSGVGGTATVGVFSYNASFVSVTSVSDYDSNKVDYGLYASGAGEILYYSSTFGDTPRAAIQGGLITDSVVININAGTGVLKSVAGLVTANATLDDISDGSSYERVVAADVTSGHVIQLIASGETLTPISATTDTFQLNSDASGVKLKDVSGALSLRNSTDNAYADLNCNDTNMDGNLTITGTDNTAKVSIQDSDTVHILDVDTTNQKVKVYNALEFQAAATITSAAGDITFGNSTSQTYFGPDGGATAHHIELENGTVAVRYANVASAVSVGQAVYISAADTVAPAKADAIATMPAIGIVVATPTTTACFVSEMGRLGGLTFASANATAYVSDVTAGLVTLTLPSGSNHVIQKLGKSRSLTDLDIKIDQQFLVLN